MRDVARPAVRTKCGANSRGNRNAPSTTKTGAYYEGLQAPFSLEFGSRHAGGNRGTGRRADLPVKAAPVEYVRVCSLYGEGFWYVPGTDTCLKIGSYVREQLEWNAGNGGVPIGFGATDAAAAGRMDRTDTSQLSERTRASISVDLRTQTEYGTLRSYFEGGFQNSSLNGTATANDSVYYDRGFIQFAGLTAGRIRSFFDINTFAPYSYGNSRISGDTGALGLWGIGYTAQFGNGVSFTVSLEDGGSASQGSGSGSAEARGAMVVDMNSAAFTPLGGISYNNEGWKVPDVVGSLRLDQSWGYAQLSGALRDVAGGYYSGVSSAGNGVGCAGTPCTNFGHPSDKLGWAISGGFTINDVFGLKGDQFGMQAVYTVGAAGYATRATGPFQVYNGNNSVGVGWVTDAAVFDNISPRLRRGRELSERAPIDLGVGHQCLLPALLEPEVAHLALRRI